MKIIDSFMYFDEDMILDIRLNILSKYVSYFIICEANYTHNGSQKKLKFDIKNFSKFKDKIVYIPLQHQPQNLKEIKQNDDDDTKNSKILDNALFRENYQRNFLFTEIKKFNDEDLIIVNDLDEIPNLETFKFKNKITFFQQKMFYYKLNLIHPDLIWYGSKICKKKNLISPQWLRNVKSKKYPFWRLDTLLSKKKYSDIGFVKNGGWHFTNIKSPEQIDVKMKNFLHHLEYEFSGLNVEDVKRIIAEKKVFYDHSADKRQDKWKATSTLNKVSDSLLPKYIKDNKDRFKEWLD